MFISFCSSCNKFSKKLISYGMLTFDQLQMIISPNDIDTLKCSGCGEELTAHEMLQMDFHEPNPRYHDLPKRSIDTSVSIDELRSIGNNRRRGLIETQVNEKGHDSSSESGDSVTLIDGVVINSRKWPPIKRENQELPCEKTKTPGTSNSPKNESIDPLRSQFIDSSNDLTTGSQSSSASHINRDLDYLNRHVIRALSLDSEGTPVHIDFNSVSVKEPENYSIQPINVSETTRTKNEWTEESVSGMMVNFKEENETETEFQTLRVPNELDLLRDMDKLLAIDALIDENIVFDACVAEDRTEFANHYEPTPLKVSWSSSIAAPQQTMNQQSQETVLSTNRQSRKRKKATQMGYETEKERVKRINNQENDSYELYKNSLKQ